ncbi:MAG: MFS transporter [Chloroflexota bacterium]
MVARGDTEVESLVGGARRSRLVDLLSHYVFYGWVIVVVGFLAQVFTSLSGQGLSTYVGPLQREFGWSASTTAAGRSFQQADSFLGPLNGWLVDRVGPRALMSAGVMLYALSFVLFSFVDALWAYYGACLMMALSNSLIGMLVVSVSVNRWFRRRRTTAMGLAVTGFAVAGIVFIPLLVWAQATYGWRTAAFATGILMLVLGLPIMLLMRDGPEPYGLLPDGDRPRHADPARRGQTRGGGLVSFTVREAFRTRAYWLITVCTGISMFVQSALVVHQFPYLEQVLDRETAALVLAELNLFNVAGRLLGGVLGDRMAKQRLMGFNLLSMVVALLLIAFGTTLAPLLVYGAFFGFSWGVRAAVSTSLLGDYFGRAAFGRIAGLTMTLASPAAIVAPIVIGWAVDVTGGSFREPFLALAVLSLIGSGLFFAASRPADPVQKPTAA